MDRSSPIGNSIDPEGRRQLHVKTFDGMVPQPDQPYDAVNAVQGGDAMTVVFKFYNGGKTGTIVQTITIEYPVSTTPPFTWVVFS